MDPDLTKQLLAGWSLAAQQTLLQQNGDQLLAIARQRDGAQEDNRVLGYNLTAMLMRAGDPGQIADFNTTSHVPTAQPFVVPNFLTPTGTMVKAA
jgi:hypothetical protein